MKVNRLVDCLRRRMTVALTGDPEEDFSGLAYHSASVSPGFLFAALPGTRDDGSKHIAEALARGARVVLHSPAAGETVAGGAAAFIGVADVRLALALASAAFFDHPSASLRVVGITGTNGKTTLTYLIESMARAAGLSCGVIGTIDYRLGAKTVSADRTTPEAPDLQRTLAWMKAGGARLVAMEVSSHALVQKRADGTCFAGAVFTNLSHDHLDFHGDMESYYQAKMRLFTDFTREASIVNFDDEWGRRLAGEIGGEVVSYGRHGESLIRLVESSITSDGVTAKLVVPGGAMELASPLMGEHNVENIVAAAAVGWRLGLAEDDIRRGIAGVDQVPGRFQKVSGKGRPVVIVDYAHTPAALEKVLRAARQLTAGRLIAVFGCGGDRDRKKRPVMGGVAARLADETILTNDNPRGEPPEAVLAEIEAGYQAARRDGYKIIADRRRAIAAAVADAGLEDAVVIAGKGHETYQIIGSTTLHFDDREEARRALSNRGEKPA